MTFVIHAHALCGKSPKALTRAKNSSEAFLIDDINRKTTGRETAPQPGRGGMNSANSSATQTG